MPTRLTLLAIVLSGLMLPGAYAQPGEVDRKLFLEQKAKAEKEDNATTDQIKLRVIVINKIASKNDSLRAFARMILEKLNAGATFAEYAAIYSEGSGRNDGGLWGWINRGKLEPELEKIAFELPPGKPSSVIERPDAFYILLVEEKRGQGPRPSLASADAKSLTTAEPDLLNAKPSGQNQAAPATKAPPGAHAQPSEGDRKLFLAEKAAAEKGYAPAQNNLGVRYEKGQGVEKALGEAANWYRKAAEQNYAMAQNNLGILCHEGQGVKQDDVEAVKWYRKAAEQNYAQAQYNLGGCYYAGQGVKKDSVEALKWYRKAAEQNYGMAQFNLGVIYEEGQVVAKDNAVAVQWYRKAAEQNHALAQSTLGLMYYEGQGVKRDYVEAYAWWSVAAVADPLAVDGRKSLAEKMSPDQIFEGYQRTKVLRAEIEAKLKAGGK